MKKKELQSIIRECVKTLIDENFLTEKIQDPTREEMLQFLQGQYGNEEGFEGDAEAAMYWFANYNHGGQDSNLYSVLSTSQFHPGPISRGPVQGSAEEMMYQSLEQEFGAGQQEVQEDGAAAGGAGGQGGMGQPGTGAGNVTANVDPIRTPHAFKKKTQEGTDDEDPLYVEYHSQRKGEEPFMMGDQKFQFVNAKYPNGKIDIGVYAFAGDMVYSYKAFNQMMNIKEEEQPEAYDDKTDTMAPGPRPRPEDWETGGASRPPTPMNELKFPIIKLKDILKNKKV